MKSLSSRALIVACALATLSLTALAAAVRAQGVPDPEVPGQRLAERLGLSSEQLERIEELKQDRLPEMARLRRELMRVQNELRGEMLKEEPSTRALERLVSRESEIRAEMRLTRLKLRLAFREVLTQEQLDKLMLMRERGVHGRFLGLRGRPLPMPPGPAPRRGPGGPR